MMGVGVRPHERPGDRLGRRLCRASAPSSDFAVALREPATGRRRPDPPGIRAGFAFSVALPYAYASVVIGKRKQFETIRPHRLAA